MTTTERQGPARLSLPIGKNCKPARSGIRSSSKIEHDATAPRAERRQSEAHGGMHRLRCPLERAHDYPTLTPQSRMARSGHREKEQDAQPRRRGAAHAQPISLRDLAARANQLSPGLMAAGAFSIPVALTLAASIAHLAWPKTKSGFSSGAPAAGIYCDQRAYQHAQEKSKGEFCVPRVVATGSFVRRSHVLPLLRRSNRTKFQPLI